jgi:hypothetical protein
VVCSGPVGLGDRASDALVTDSFAQGKSGSSHSGQTGTAGNQGNGPNSATSGNAGGTHK